MNFLEQKNGNEFFNMFQRATSSMSLLNKLHLGLDFKLVRKFSIYGGITFNGYITEISATDKPNVFKNYQPPFIHNQNGDSPYTIASWWGAKVVYAICNLFGFTEYA